jgi:predicted RNA binding protein YcfA (HicA-like mRNA interferase family)
VPSSIPVVPGSKVVRALEKAGFFVARVNGSHHLMKHPSGRSVVVPVHGGRDLHTPTLRNILIAAGLTPDEFRALL